MDFLIEQAQGELHADQGTGQRSQKAHSLLNDLIAQTDNKEEIRNHLIQAMMAAQDTVSILIANALSLLSRDPSMWARVRQEANGLQKSGMTFDALRSNRLLQNILNESKDATHFLCKAP